MINSSLANFSLKFPSLDGRGEGRVKIPVVSPTYPPPSRGRNQGQKNAKLKMINIELLTRKGKDSILP